METKMYEYRNNRIASGVERVYADNGRYFVSSNWGSGFGEKKEVSREDMVNCLKFTNAPAHVVAGILG